MIDYLGIRFIAASPAVFTAEMPVNAHTRQPRGRLHGGALAALAETVASVGAGVTIRGDVVGIEINANHVRGVTDGVVTAHGSPLHVGKSTQVWEVKIVDADQKLVCVSRLTLMNILPSV